MPASESQGRQSSRVWSNCSQSLRNLCNHRLLCNSAYKNKIFGAIAALIKVLVATIKICNVYKLKT